MQTKKFDDAKRFYWSFKYFRRKKCKNDSTEHLFVEHMFLQKYSRWLFLSVINNNIFASSNETLKQNMTTVRVTF